MSFLQLLINGFALGMAYALVALGFVLVLNAVSAVNFAQGDLVMAGGYRWVALAHVLPVPAIISCCRSFSLRSRVIGLVLSLLAYFPIMRRPPAAVFISTIAFGVILQNGYQLIFGPEAHAVRPLWSSGVFSSETSSISRQAIGIVATAAVLMASQYYVMEKTQFGRRLRATAQNRDMAAALGIPVRRMIGYVRGVAALAGAAGLLLGNQFLVHPIGGVQLIIAAYIAAVIGGWGSLMGAVLGAMLIALFEVIVSAYVSYTAATAMLYLVVLIVLFFRPQGLLGRGEQRRV